MGDTSLTIPGNRKIGIEFTPISRPIPLQKRVCGACAAEATPQCSSDLVTSFTRSNVWDQSSIDSATLSQNDVFALEEQLREAALSTNDFFLLGLNAQPAIEEASGELTPFLSPPSGPAGGNGSQTGLGVLGALGRGGIYQLTSFPITRFNGIPLPVDSRIRFADPSRWLQGGMESRLFTISVDGTGKYHAWDAHWPVGKTAHDFFHVNQKGMYSVFSQSDHAALTGAALVQAKQLRYLKMGGRVFLVVGVVVDGIQLGVAANQSYEQGSVKPVAAQAVRTAGSWGMAWAGAKAGVALGGLAGVETGPGVVLTAIGGGIIGGVAGYMGADWIADFIYED